MHRKKNCKVVAHQLSKNQTRVCN